MTEPDGISRPAPGRGRDYRPRIWPSRGAWPSPFQAVSAQFCALRTCTCFTATLWPCTHL